MTTTYLDFLKESTFNTHPSVKNHSLNFGDELMEDILLQEGIFLDYSILNEGIFSMPMNKLKSIVGNITQDVSSVEGMKKIEQKYGKMASAISPSDLKNQAMKLAASKGIPAGKVNSLFEKIMRSLALYEFAASTLLTPIGWILIIVSLIKSGSFEKFAANTKEMMSEIKKGIESSDGEFNKALALGGTAWKFILICFIPPWIQQIIFLPAAGILLICGFISYIRAVLRIMK